MNKRGQVTGVIFVIATIVILLLMAPILIKLVIVPSAKFSTSLSAIDPTNKSSDAVNYTMNTFTRWFDWVVFFFIMFSVVALLFTSFLVDVHPAFFFIYFIAMIAIMIFAPLLLNALDRIYDCTNYMSASACSGVGGWTSEIAYLPITHFIYNNFGVFILSIMILSGAIMYGKFRWGGNQNVGEY
jgi:hypothetical protein